MTWGQLEYHKNNCWVTICSNPKVKYLECEKNWLCCFSFVDENHVSFEYHISMVIVSPGLQSFEFIAAVLVFLHISKASYRWQSGEEMVWRNCCCSFCGGFSFLETQGRGVEQSHFSVNNMSSPQSGQGSSFVLYFIFYFYFLYSLDFLPPYASTFVHFKCISLTSTFHMFI